MTIIGFNFKKIEVEKKKEMSGRVNINNNVAVKSVDKVDISFGKADQEGAKFTYEFVSTYSPDIGSIKLTGEIVYMDSAKAIKELVEGWKKKKDVPKDTMAAVLNHVLSKCNIEALILSREINLPPPIPMPKVQEKGESKK